MTHTYFRVVDRHGVPYGHSCRPSEYNADARRRVYDRTFPERGPWRVQWQTVSDWQDHHPESETMAA